MGRPSVPEDTSTRLARLEEQLHQFIVRGLVTQVDPKKYMLKVKYPAQDNVESDWLQVLTVKSHKDKYFALPDIDEQVLVLHIPGAQDVGYILGTTYSIKNPPPPTADSVDITMANWQDGTWFKHDRKSGDVELHVKGKLTIAVEKDIYIGTNASIHLSAASIITARAPSEITLGDAAIININSKTDTNIVGSTNLTLMSSAKSELYSDGVAEVKAAGELTLAASGNAYLSSHAELHCNGQAGAHYTSNMITSVWGDMELLYGAPISQLSGVNLVEMAERVSGVAPPIAAETKTPDSPGKGAAGLPAATTPAPKPVVPVPYIFPLPPRPGGTPPAPGPGEGPTSKAQIK